MPGRSVPGGRFRFGGVAVGRMPGIPGLVAVGGVRHDSGPGSVPLVVPAGARGLVSVSVGRPVHASGPVARWGMPGAVPGMRLVRGVPARMGVVPATGVPPRRTVPCAVPSLVMPLVVRVMSAPAPPAGGMPARFAVITGDIRGVAPPGFRRGAVPPVLVALVQPAPQLV